MENFFREAQRMMASNLSANLSIKKWVGIPKTLGFFEFNLQIGATHSWLIYVRPEGRPEERMKICLASWQGRGWYLPGGDSYLWDMISYPTSTPKWIEDTTFSLLMQMLRDIPKLCSLVETTNATLIKKKAQEFLLIPYYRKLLQSLGKEQIEKIGKQMGEKTEHPRGFWVFTLKGVRYTEKLPPNNLFFLEAYLSWNSRLGASGNEEGIIYLLRKIVEEVNTLT